MVIDRRKLYRNIFALLCQESQVKMGYLPERNYQFESDSIRVWISECALEYALLQEIIIIEGDIVILLLILYKFVINLI